MRTKPSFRTGLEQVVLVGGLAVATLLPAAPPAAACSCVFDADANHACFAFADSDAIFLGRVSEIEEIWRPEGEGRRSDEPAWPERRVRFVIEEVFRGVDGTEVEVTTGMGGGDCGYGFEVGESYLVYAYGAASGRPATGICTRTAPASAAASDLAYLRARAAGEPVPGLVGRVVRVELPSPEDYPERRGIAGVRIAVAGPGGEDHRAVTDADGRFEVAGRLEGEYLLSARLDDGRELAEKRAEVPPRGCTSAVWELSDLGSVAGRLELAADAPDPNVELMPVGADPEELSLTMRARDDGGFEGGFEISDVPPGEYVLAFNVVGPSRRSHYPPAWFAGSGIEPASEIEGAKPIEVAPGSRIDLGEVLPPPLLDPVPLRGVVVHPDRSPAPSAMVRARLLPEGSKWEEATSEGERGFEIEVLDGLGFELCGVGLLAGQPIYGSLEVQGGVEGPVELVLDSATPCR